MAVLTAFLAPFPLPHLTRPVSLTARRPLRSHAHTVMVSQPPNEPPSTPPADDYGLDTDALKEKALEVVGDVSSRPFYYSKIFAYVVGSLVGFTVLRSVVSAIDSIPVLPGALELVGLGYTVWFIWRYVLFQESREELIDEFEDFLGRARPNKH